MMEHGHRVSIAGPELRVTVDPAVGGSITGIEHLGSGLSVLGKVPWNPVETPIAGLAARDEAEWLTRYTGGWPLLFPNGGNCCIVDGVFHGFHGEASISPWGFSAEGNSIRLSRRFHCVPAEMERELAIDGDLLVIHERLRMLGPESISVMWGHHPTFGSDLLAGPVEITCGGGLVTVDGLFDPPANPLRPGAKGAWPVVEGKNGTFDLGHPVPVMSALAYLHGYAEAWIAVRRLDGAAAVVLSWEASRFPCAWLWYELGGTPEAPWLGRANLIGLEPNTTMPGHGIAIARSSGGSLLQLSPGDEIATALRLQVFKPRGRITSIDHNGRARGG